MIPIGHDPGHPGLAHRLRVGAALPTLNAWGCFAGGSHRSRWNRCSDLDRLTAEFHAEAERLAPELLREAEAEAARIVAALDAKYPKTPPPPRSKPAPPVVLGPNGGPTWMSAKDWTDRLAAYRRQGRPEADIRRVAEHLERRGPQVPWTPQQKIARAKSVGYVARVEFLTPEDEARALVPGPDGFPDAWFECERDRLLIATPLGWVNPSSRTAASRAGLWSFKVRGIAYHKEAAKRGDFTPGAPLRLVREPDNKDDSNAIGVYAAGVRARAAYVPRGYAKRLAKLLDDDAGMVAVSVRGSGGGCHEVTPHILVCERALFEHLNRTPSRNG